MKEINEESQTTFVFSTHDPLMQQHAKRVVVLKDGKVDSDERR
jgi:putative ABC transport system ATP-binding protein